MASRLYTTEELIEVVYQRIGGDDTEAVGTSKDDVMRYLTDAYLGDVVPKVLGLREDFFVVEEHIALVSGQLVYPIPDRAIGKKINSVKWVDQTPTPQERYELRRILSEDNTKSQWIGESSRSSLRYFIRGNDIVLAGTNPTLTGLLEVAYYFQPGDFIRSTGYRKIVHPDDTNLVDGAFLVETSAKTSDSEFVIGEKIDIHGGIESSGEIKAWDLTLSGATDPGNPIGANAFGFDEDWHSMTVSDGDTALQGSTYGRKQIAVGDYAVVQGRAALPMFLPRNAHLYLAQVAATAILASWGDEEAVRASLARQERLEESLVLAHDDRVEGAPQRFTTNRGVWRTGGARCRR